MHNDPKFEVTHAPTSQDVWGSDPTKLKYKLTDTELEYKVILDRKMAADEQTAMNEVIQMMETKPSSSLGNGQPDVPAMREQLVILVSTGKAKEAMCVQLTQDQVKRLEEKDVETYYKRYETYVGAITTETFVDSFLSLYARAAAIFVRIKDAQALQNALKKDYVIQKSCPPLSKVLR